MSFKSLMSVLTDIDQVDGTVTALTKLAMDFDAHAETLCLGVDRSQAGYYYAGANAMVLQESMQRAQEEAKELLERSTALLDQPGLRWATNEAVAPLADLGRHVAHRARFTDLCVAPLPYGENRGLEHEAVVEAALFEGRTPVLVLPDMTPPSSKPGTVVLAWNESVEALAAARRALPFLKRADLVRITVIDPPSHGPERSDPGGPLSQFLARHGVNCEIDVLSRSLMRVSDVLNRHVMDSGADMIVMGAYGHSRFREAILGGATRHMLEKATVPVFMAH
ncbi:MAG: universal stress protein [Arenibacterium sp.]